jgi:hypothetical protein
MVSSGRGKSFPRAKMLILASNQILFASNKSE